MTELQQLEKAIQELEDKRGILGDEVVEAALAPMRGRLAELQEQPKREEQLKYVTVMFVDVTGSTHMARSLDPEDLRDVMGGALGSFSQIIEKYDGSVAKYLGDGFMAIFGTPASKEDDPERAVRAGLEIVQSAKVYARHVAQAWRIEGFNVRVGLNTGQVVLGGELEDDNVAMGMPINIAQRMESAAPHGGMLITHSTYQHVRGIFKVQRQPPLKVKGREQPVRAYLVEGVEPITDLAARRGVEGVNAPTIGRESELEQLRIMYKNCLDNKLTSLVTLIGDPGVGKSRLSGEFEHWLQTNIESELVFKGRALPQTAATPFSLLRDMTINQLQILDGDSVELVQYKIENGMAGYLGEDGLMKAHYIGALLGFDFSDSPYLTGVKDDPNQLREQGLYYLTRFIHATADTTPVVLILDDIHWGDPASLEFVQTLSRVGGSRLFILAMTRPDLVEKLPDWGEESKTEHTIIERMYLPPLDDSASVALLENLLRKVTVVPEALPGIVVKYADGNPYYIEELINIMIDDGVITRDEEDQAWQVDEGLMEELRIPPTLTAVLQARLDSLQGREKETMQQASVIGRVFWDLPLALMGNLENAPDDTMEALCQRDLIYPQTTATFDDTDEYIFKHALMRDVAYKSLLKRRKRAYHAITARWLAGMTECSGRAQEYAAVIAEHYELAGQATLAAEWYLNAGKHARSQGAPGEARAFFDRAMELNPDSETDLRWQILVERSEVLEILGDQESRHADNREMMEMAEVSGDPERIAEANFNLGYSFYAAGEDENALQPYVTAGRAAREAGNQKIEAQVLSLKVVSLTRLGRQEEAKSAADEALSLALKLDDDLTLARTLTNVSIYYNLSGDLSGSVEMLRQQVAINHRTGNRMGESIGLSNLGYNYVLLGMYEAASKALEESLNISEAIGSRRIAAYTLLNLGLAYFRTADFKNARQVLNNTIPELEDIGDQFGQAAGLSYLGLIDEATGELSRADKNYRAANQIFESIGAASYAVDALSGMARCALANKDLTGALLIVDQVCSHLDENGAAGMEFPIWSYLTCCEVYSANGDPDKSRKAVEKGYNELLARADAISDQAWREFFLMEVPEHGEILEKWRAENQG